MLNTHTWEVVAINSRGQRRVWYSLWDLQIACVVLYNVRRMVPGCEWRVRRVRP